MSCGLSLDRDYNAALNIKALGLSKIFATNTAGTAGIYACGDTSNGEDGMSSSSYVSLKQEATSSLGTW